MIALDGRRGAVLAPHVVLVATPLPNGTQVLIPIPRGRRTCTRADGRPKIAYERRRDARRARRPGQRIYRCTTCGRWHIATPRPLAERGPAYAPAVPRRRSAERDAHL